MEVIKGDGTLLKDIDLAPANTHQEVIQNIAIILVTVRNSVPMLRGLGIDGRLIGRPLPVAESLIVGEIYEQIEKYEPRAIISGIDFEQDALTGMLIPLVKLEGVKEDGDE